MKNKVVCSRFGSLIPRYSSVVKKDVPIKLTGRRNIQVIDYVATDGLKIKNALGVWALDYFLENNTHNLTALMVLTDKERDLLIKYLLNKNIEIISFEANFPIFDGIKFCNDIEKSYAILLQKLRTLKSYGIEGRSLSESLYSKIRKKIGKKIKSKTNLDKFFAHAYTPPYQEVFRFVEYRKNRKILALDYNSMFAYCMRGEFVSPQAVYVEKINIKYTGEQLKSGLYHVTLVNPNCEFIKKFHPFKFTTQGVSVNFEAKNNIRIDIQIFSFEVEYYSKFFDEIILNDAIVSDKTQGHPCYPESIRLYRLRQRARSSGNRSLERLYKYQLAMLHSATNPRRYKVKDFDSLQEVSDFLIDEFCIDGSDNLNTFKDSLESYNFFNLTSSGDKFNLRYLDIDNCTSVFSFSSQVLARARIEMVKTLEILNQFDGLDVCYVNTDSVHVSIPEEKYSLFLEKYGSIIGANIGQMKLQTVADKGIWFDLGHYYLLDKNFAVIFYKSSFLNKRGSVDPFPYGRKIIFKYRCLNNDFLAERFISLRSILSCKKFINQDCEENKIDFCRFSFDECGCYKKIKLKILSERYQSNNIKIKYFKELKFLNSK